MAKFANILPPSIDLFTAIGFTSDKAEFLSYCSFATNQGKDVDLDNVVWSAICDELSDSLSDNSREGYLAILKRFEPDYYPEADINAVTQQVTNWDDMAIVPNMIYVLEALCSQFDGFNITDVETLKSLLVECLNTPEISNTLPSFLWDDVIIRNPFEAPSGLFPAIPVYQYGIENIALWAFELAQLIDKGTLKVSI